MSDEVASITDVALRLREYRGSRNDELSVRVVDRERKNADGSYHAVEFPISPTDGVTGYRGGRAVIVSRSSLPLTFDEVADANRDRCTEWHIGADTWTGADWSNAMCGEAGEAANVVKKLRRIETHCVGKDDPSETELVAMLADELADTFLYLDLLAAHYDIDLPTAIRDKFNRVSKVTRFPQRIA